MAREGKLPTVEQQEDGTADYTPYATLQPTRLQDEFADWIVDKTGVDPSGAKSKAAAFAEGVRLGVALRIPYQRSPENRASREQASAAKAEAVAAPKPAKKVAPKPAPPAKATAGRRGKAAAAANPAEAEAPESPPATRRRGARRGAAAAEAAF
jgi:hypothetical protein